MIWVVIWSNQTDLREGVVLTFKSSHLFKLYGYNFLNINKNTLNLKLVYIIILNFLTSVRAAVDTNYSQFSFDNNIIFMVRFGTKLT